MTKYWAFREHITKDKDNVAEKYGYWLRAAVQRWRNHWSV